MLSILTFVMFVEVSGAEGIHKLYPPNEEREVYMYDITTFLTLGANIKAGIFYIDGAAKIIMYPMQLISFYPAGISSFVEVGILYEGLSIGYRRQCSHPIVPSFNQRNTYLYADSAGGEFFIRVEISK